MGRDGGVGGGTTSSATTGLVKDRTLTLTLDKKDYLIEPVYSALEFVPTNEKNEKWPPCPVGWKFSDWLLLNTSKVPITISRLAWMPLHQEFPDGCTPLINEPQGSEQIKLSFDRLMLNPGESAKFSICTNPAASSSADSEITFGWNLGDLHYAVFFTGQGSPSMTRKRTLTKGGWSGTDESFDFDKNNRTLTFRAEAQL
jgi:hypothetical protein